jgi:thymidylate synthase (FAD)
MSVKIIGFTQPVVNNENGTQMTLNEFIAYCARVSNPANQNNHLTASKLLKYCATHKHWSIFEMAHITMSIETTRDIARQILRHRSFSFQEFSQRYADPTKDLGFVERETRFQDNKNRQSSIDVNQMEDLHTTYTIRDDWTGVQLKVQEQAKIAYDWAIKHGIAKEQARAVLPEGLTVSRMYMAGSIRSWIHYVTIRSNKDTQKEHREIAIACWDEIIKLIPSLKDLNLLDS